MNLRFFVRSITLLIVVFSTFLFPAPPNAVAESSRITFTLGTPGVAFDQPGMLLIAVPIFNTSDKNALRVKIDSMRLDSAPLLTSTPIRLRRIRAGQSAIIEAQFDSSPLVPEMQYELVIRGSYRVRPPAQGDGDSESGRLKFTLRTLIVVPTTLPGSAIVESGSVLPQQVTGAPFPSQPPSFEEEVNPEGPPVPTASFVPGTPTLVTTGVQALPGINKAPEGVAGPIVFHTNNGLGLTSGTSTTAEPSGAAGGGVVFVTANWTAAYSTDGGNTFTQLDPTTVFPNNFDGGFCCDQIVQYASGIDRFIWLMQFSRGAGGQNRLRIASASPADIISSNGTAWTYWDLTPAFFGLSSTSWLDYPDLSVGNRFLYMSVDEVGVGLLVARLPLSQIQASGTVFVEFTDPTLSSMAYFSHLTQNTGDEIFWAGHNSNRQLRVFSLQENSNSYSWRDINIATWANHGLSSITPDGEDWLEAAELRGFTAPIGATRSRNQLLFAWNAGPDRNFPQPHIEMVAIDRSNNFQLVGQMQIWNPDYAFAYPALATNYCTGEVGLSFEFGGGGNYENHVVGIWGDFVAYITTGSNVGTDRFGDYVTIRQAPPTAADPGNLFTAFGYGLNTNPLNGVVTPDIRYVLFGRPASSCAIGI
jgi:hypothetical protein